MAYELSAVIGEVTMLSGIGREHGVPVVPLAEGLALIPLTDAIATALFEPDLRFEEVLRAWSARGPVLYAWSEMHAGLGVQSATIWAAGELTYHETGYPGRGPISLALQRLGVTGGSERRDEFDIVGLGRYRRTSAWTSGVPGGQWPRAIQSDSDGFSAPMVVPSPWPVCTVVSSGRVSRRSRMESMMVPKSE